MKAFCPNCGSSNEGMPGGRVTCRTCTTSYEVPRGIGQVQQAPAPTHGAPPTRPQDRPFGAALQESLSTARPRAATSGGTYNPLAIASVIMGTIFCFGPIALGAVICGVLALQQIKASGGVQQGRVLAIIGIVGGSLGTISSIVTLAALFLSPGTRS